MSDFQIDESWIDDFDQVEKLYNGLYTEQLQNVLVYFLYVNMHNELFHIKKNQLEINDCKLSKEHLVFLLKKNQIYNNKKFHPITIMKYNINLKPRDIMHYLKHTGEYSFLSFETNINAISWEDSIPLFHDLNSLFIVYAENVKGKNTTKKVYIRRKNRRKTKRKYT